MPVLDHVFICCSPEGVEADRVARLGLTEGQANTHPGQGTASRRFFFSNAYLELLWVNDPEEAQGPLPRRTRLWERWAERAAGACPFGVVTRPRDPSDRAAPFPAWDYHPPYLPPTVAIEIAQDTPLSEPGLFHLAFARSPEETPAQPRAHRLGLGEVSRVTITLPGRAPLSAPAQAVERASIVSFARGEAYLMTLAFDTAVTGRADLRPHLPLVLEW